MQDYIGSAGLNLLHQKLELKAVEVSRIRARDLKSGDFQILCEQIAYAVMELKLNC